MILVDTSVWAGHLRSHNALLASRLGSSLVVTHDFVLGELLLAHVKRRAGLLNDLALLPRLAMIPHPEVLEFARAAKLEGSGVGWVDAHLLAAAVAARCTLWTLDRTLRAAAARLGVAEDV